MAKLTTQKWKRATDMVKGAAGAAVVAAAAAMLARDGSSSDQGSQPNTWEAWRNAFAQAIQSNPEESSAPVDPRNVVDARVAGAGAAATPMATGATAAGKKTIGAPVAEASSAAPSTLAVDEYITRRIQTAPEGSDLATYCVGRGLVGQRGPLHEKATTAPSGVPFPDDFEKVDTALDYEMPTGRHPPFLDRTATLRELRLSARNDAAAVDHASQPDNLDRLAMEVEAAFVELNDDFAMIPTYLNVNGIEGSFVTQWLPKGHMAEEVAHSAAFEHGSVRCATRANSGDLDDVNDVNVKLLLKLASASLVLRRLRSQEALILARRRDATLRVDFHHGSSTLASDASEATNAKRETMEKMAKTATRPHAQYGGRLVTPVDLGVVDIPSTRPGSAPPALPWTAQRPTTLGGSASSYGKLTQYVQDTTTKSNHGNGIDGLRLFVGPETAQTEVYELSLIHL